MGKETVRKEDFVSAALTPRADGSPSLVLPRAWDYRDPQGYIQAVIVQRLHDKAARVMWDQTHKASLGRGGKAGEDHDGQDPAGAGAVVGGGTGNLGGANAQQPTHGSGAPGAGAGPGAGGAAKAGGGGPKVYPAGKALSKDENELSRTHAPVDAKGRLKCWDAASHMGCRHKASECPRSHEAINGAAAVVRAVPASPPRRPPG